MNAVTGRRSLLAGAIDPDQDARLGNELRWQDTLRQARIPYRWSMLDYSECGHPNRNVTGPYCRWRADFDFASRAWSCLRRTTLHGKARHQRKQGEQQADHREAI